MSAGRNIREFAVRIVCALALLFLGLSHKMPLAADVQSPTLAFSQAYSLPDGTAPDLCVPMQQGKISYSSSECDACRLAGSVLLPQPPMLATYALLLEEPSYSLPVQAAIISTINRAQSARGPPAFLLS